MDVDWGGDGLKVPSTASLARHGGRLRLRDPCTTHSNTHKHTRPAMKQTRPPARFSRLWIPVHAQHRVRNCQKIQARRKPRRGIANFEHPELGNRCSCTDPAIVRSVRFRRAQFSRQGASRCQQQGRGQTPCVLYASRTRAWPRNTHCGTPQVCKQNLSRWEQACMELCAQGTLTSGTLIHGFRYIIHQPVLILRHPACCLPGSVLHMHDSSNIASQ